MRTTPRCRIWRVRRLFDAACEFSAQVANKQRVLENNLAHIGRVTPKVILPPIYGPHLGLSPPRPPVGAPCTEKKGGVLVGFHEKRSCHRRHAQMPYSAERISAFADACASWSAMVDCRAHAAGRAGGGRRAVDAGVPASWTR